MTHIGNSIVTRRNGPFRIFRKCRLGKCETKSNHFKSLHMPKNSNSLVIHKKKKAKIRLTSEKTVVEISFFCFLILLIISGHPTDPIIYCDWTVLFDVQVVKHSSLTENHFISRLHHPSLFSRNNLCPFSDLLKASQIKFPEKVCQKVHYRADITHCKL